MQGGGSSVRSAAGEHHNLDEHVKGTDDHIDHDIIGHRAQSGHGDIGKLLPKARAVQLCRLIQFVRNALQSCQKDQHGPTYVLPDTHEPDSRVARPLPQKPGNVVVHQMKNIHQQVVDEPAVGVIEHILEN